MIPITLVLGLMLSSPPAQRRAEDPVAVARHFLPPNTQLVELYTFDYTAGRVRSRSPAVLTAHVLDPDSDDVLFAYYSPRGDTLEKTLFITLLHSTGQAYEKAYEVAYRAQVLLVPEAIRLVRLPGMQTDAVAVIAGIGASLGGHLDVFLWRDPWGWQNVFPPNGGVEYFYFRGGASEMRVALSSAHHPGTDNMPAPDPPPMWFRWNGKEFVKTQ